MGLIALTCVVLPAQTKQSDIVPDPSGQPGRIVDFTASSGVHFMHQALHTCRRYLIETMGSGAALFDCDNESALL